MTFGLGIDPDMYLWTGVDQVGVKITSPQIPLKKWTMIYASYIYPSGGLGISKVYINGVEGADQAKITSLAGPTAFSMADKIGIGPGFTGQIRRVQLYSPAPLEIQDPGNIFIILQKTYSEKEVGVHIFLVVLVQTFLFQQHVSKIYATQMDIIPHLELVKYVQQAVKHVRILQLVNHASQNMNSVQHPASQVLTNSY